MPLLQESTKRGLLTPRDIKVEDDNSQLKTNFSSVGFPSPFTDATLFTQSQLLMASQFMAASRLAIPTNPAFFHPGFLGPITWPPNSPESPNSNPQLSPARKHNTINNNNNIVSSSSIDVKPLNKKRWEEDSEIASPTSSSSSPPSSTDISSKDVSRDKQFTCTVCNRSFGYKHVLQNHERTHTGEKPFECPECHKRFTRDHHLKTHMRLHTGERPYHCEHCDRQFVQVANLRRHLRVHTGERPYACEYCSAKFSDSNQLKAHLLIHADKKPYDREQNHGRFRRKHRKEVKIESEPLDDESIARLRTPPAAPILSLPLPVSLPEQTEPEDLSMSTGMHSPISNRSTSSWGESEEDKDYIYPDHLSKPIDLRGNPKS
ncbi:hypothetical protein WA026_003734 [Henosepilachna vigintioctopunctata]|uniref:C2H2-type domain-containing protein n=1 Tax=Henosepilachna vigintioctopunctata TaxID=420089 RepID=A0AAW1U5H0_9CUCU